MHIIIIIILYYRLAEHINRYMTVVQYIVSTLCVCVSNNETYLPGFTKSEVDTMIKHFAFVNQLDRFFLIFVLLFLYPIVPSLLYE